MSSPPPPDDKPLGNEPYLTRLPVDSPVRRDLITRARHWLGWLGLLIPLGVCAALVFAGSSSRRYSPGPVSAAHATWDDRCAACHESSRVIQSASDEKCTTCHAGPAHHVKQHPDVVPGCRECHREHQGKGASLTRVPDSFCTRCHANLDPRVHGFDAGDEHPPFRFEREKQPDPGRLKFNHQRHLTPGMPLTPNGDPFAIAQVARNARERYRAPGQTGLDTPVTLTCAHCHQLDSQEAGASPPLLARGSGDYMVPVTYERRCRACHPLGIERKAPDDPRTGLIDVPHRLQPDGVRGWLEMLYTSRLMEKPTLPSSNPFRPKPGRDPEAEALAKTAREHVRGQVARAQVELYASNKTCGKCHYLTPDLATLAPDRFDTLRVVPTAVPQVWLKDARFDHSAHRALDCRECHAKAFAFDAGGKPNPDAGHDAKDVMLPGIATCAKCHAPARGADLGGARHDCVECHRYHGGDHPLHGRGAEVRGVPVEGRMGTTQFNHGKK